MINVEIDLDKQERNGKHFQAGTAYAGNPMNFHEGFDAYKRDLLSLHNRIANKLEQLKEDKEKLPWE